MPLKTGQCSAGWCEGKHPVDWRGEPAPCCKLWLTCPCSCHDLVTRMLEIAGEPRRHLDNPKYLGPKLKFTMPSRDELLKERAAREQNTHKQIRVIESPVPELIPDSLIREYEPTVSGRSGRGQLEQNVKLACDAYLMSGAPLTADENTACTTLWVQEWINSNQKVLPSRGAIDAVWKRWVEIGFAFTMHRPTRFITYTPDGVKYGLEELKVRAKRRTQVIS